MTNGADDSAVVVGIIDDGIAFAHQRFRKIGRAGSVESRVEYWWLQDGPYVAPGRSMPPISSGRQLSKKEIDKLLADCTHAGAIDEEEFYRRAGLTDFRLYGHKSAAWRIAHGTHVMDLACGYDQDQAGDDRPIVCVQFPIRVTADTSGATLFPYVHQAIWYILDCADRIAAHRGVDHLPVVINLSYGYFAGPHDGTSHFEVMIDRIIDHCKHRGIELRVTLPVGNSYILRTHAQVQFGLNNELESEVACLHWRVLPDGKTPSYLQIWLPYHAHPIRVGRLQFTVTSPTGQSWTINEFGRPIKFGGVNPFGTLQYIYRAGQTQRGMFLVTLCPTKHVVEPDPNPTHALAPAGVWKVELTNKALADGEIVQLWVQRDDSLYGFPIRGRQSYFDEESYVRFDHEGRDNEIDDPACPVRRYGTINAIATGRKPIVMAGFLRKEMKAAKYSSAGPITQNQGAAAADPYRPDAMAPTDDSLVHFGLLAAGSRSGSVVAMNGTSVAAPRTARLIAYELAGGLPADRTSIQNLAAYDEGNYPAGTPPQQPPERTGAGRIDLPPIVKLQRYWP
jgi:hypothetical protein